MSILGWIGGKIVGAFASIGHSILELLGLKRKPKAVTKARTKAEANAELRRQWLELLPDEQTEGVEYEGEVYYDTVK